MTDDQENETLQKLESLKSDLEDIIKECRIELDQGGTIAKPKTREKYDEIESIYKELKDTIKDALDRKKKKLSDHNLALFELRALEKKIESIK